MKLRDISDSVRRLFDLEPQYAVDGIARTIMLTQDVSELAGERIGRTYSLRTTIAAVAGEYQHISLQRPAGLLGVDVEIIEVHLRNQSATIVYFGAGTSATSTDRGAGYAHDLRNLAAGYRSGAHLTDESNAAQLLAAQGELQTGTMYAPWKTSIFLQPGGLFTFCTQGVNQGLTGMLVWRETPRVERP